MRRALKGAAVSASTDGFVGVVEEERGHLPAIISRKIRRASYTLLALQRKPPTLERHALCDQCNASVLRQFRELADL